LFFEANDDNVLEEDPERAVLNVQFMDVAYEEEATHIPFNAEQRQQRMRSTMKMTGAKTDLTRRRMAL
jgi:hypothetical protein